MTQVAAFRACYSDWKLIKTRSVVQVILEIPIEHSDLAYQVLGGMPNPAEERWLGVARLDLSKLGGETPAIPTAPAEAAGSQQDRPHKLRKPVAAEKKLAMQAGICCADPVFQRFLSETWPALLGWACDEEAAADFVRDHCRINSRAELAPGSVAADRWIDLHGQFEAWKLVAA